MRWQPSEPVCPECGFDWSTGRSDCLVIVAECPQRAGSALDAVADPLREAGARWSASMYVWHLVDVLRIGAERLTTLRLDPGRGVPCWDENLLAEARRYRHLSPVVAPIVLEVAARQWLDAAEMAPDTAIEHPQFGTLRTIDVLRRTAHEVVHHLRDIAVGGSVPVGGRGV